MTSLHLVPDVPVPTGYTPDGWSDLDTDSPPWRTIWGIERDIKTAIVRVSGLQHVDSTIEVVTDEAGNDESPAVHVYVRTDWGVSAADARQLAALLLEAADEADRLAGNQTRVGSV